MPELSPEEEALITYLNPRTAVTRRLISLLPFGGYAVLNFTLGWENKLLDIEVVHFLDTWSTAKGTRTFYLPNLTYSGCFRLNCMSC